MLIMLICLVNVYIKKQNKGISLSVVRRYMFMCSEQCAEKSHNLKTGNISVDIVEKFKNLVTSCDM